ncbi:MAG TPA: hypothetical protein DHW22_11225, partial [Planctomycetaceae bacterium]|nr:hypothetical protein [Planctomycetaceae bacterium]
AQKHQRKPAEIMVLEDSQIGCQSAIAANCYVVAIPGGQYDERLFSDTQLIADSLADERIYEALNIL